MGAVEVVGELAEDLARDVVLPCHMVISVTPPDCFVVCLPSPPLPADAATAAASAKGGCGSLQHLRGGKDDRAGQVRGRPGRGRRPRRARPRSAGRARARRAGRARARRRPRPAARTLSQRRRRPARRTTPPRRPAMLIGPWRYSKAGYASVHAWADSRSFSAASLASPTVQPRPRKAQRSAHRARPAAAPRARRASATDAATSKPSWARSRLSAVVAKRVCTTDVSSAKSSATTSSAAARPASPGPR